MDPSALAAAAQADEIEVSGRWHPALTLVAVILGSGGLWALLTFLGLRALTSR